MEKPIFEIQEVTFESENKIPLMAKLFLIAMVSALVVLVVHSLIIN